jgi:hypothetical protein
MTRWRINTLLGRLKDTDPKLAEYRSIYNATGVATSTISGIVNGTRRVDLDVVDRLLGYFNEHLGPLTTQDLIEFVPDGGKKGGA